MFVINIKRWERFFRDIELRMRCWQQLEIIIKNHRNSGNCRWLIWVLFFMGSAGGRFKFYLKNLQTLHSTGSLLVTFEITSLRTRLLKCQWIVHYQLKRIHVSNRMSKKLLRKCDTSFAHLTPWWKVIPLLPLTEPLNAFLYLIHFHPQHKTIPANICSSFESEKRWRERQKSVQISLNARWSTKRNCSFLASYPIPRHLDAVAAFLRSHVPSSSAFYRSINSERGERKNRGKAKGQPYLPLNEMISITSLMLYEPFFWWVRCL